eukprot:scaffold504_cov189-Ochromonas_danica.AAC.21
MASPSSLTPGRTARHFVLTWPDFFDGVPKCPNRTLKSNFSRFDPVVQLFLRPGAAARCGLHSLFPSWTSTLSFFYLSTHGVILFVSNLTID